MIRKEIPETLSSGEAYEALTRLLWDWAERTKSTDLSTLYADMQIYSPGLSVDPAVLGEWKRFWGVQSRLSPAAALAVCQAFLDYQRAWSDEAAVSDLLLMMKESTNQQGIWAEWLSALAHGIT
jgi:hypothetical protein